MNSADIAQLDFSDERPPTPLEGARDFGLEFARVIAINLVALAILLYAFMFVMFGHYERLMKPRAFDAALWRSRATDDSGDNLRAWMVDDLVAQHQLVGKTRAEVEALLGPADVGLLSGTRRFGYVTGPARWHMEWEPEQLRFRVDDAGRVTEYEI